ncbi:MAG: hypothetical protein Q4D06_07820 [Coriobacteriia bacterium]|nr:hypothetical protein [Coriobacteriia bacterium]
MPDIAKDPVFLVGASALPYWLSPRPKSLDTTFEQELASCGQDPSSIIPFLGSTMAFPPLHAVPDNLRTALSAGQSHVICSSIGGWPPVHVLSSGSVPRTSTQSYQRSVLPRRIPKHCYVKVSERIFVPRPELALLQSAAILDLVELTVLCSLFFSVFCFRGDSSRLVPRRALCSKESVRAFLDSCTGSGLAPAGADLLKRAVRLAVEQTASPAELSCGLRMELPISLDGYGFAGARHNACVSTGDSPDDVRWCDWLWKTRDGRLVAVEYESDQEHQGDARRKRDRKRDNELIAANITPISLLSEHFASTAAMDVAARQIGKTLGRRPFPDDDDSRAGRERLRRKIASMLNRLRGLVA